MEKLGVRFRARLKRLARGESVRGARGRVPDGRSVFDPLPGVAAYLLAVPAGGIPVDCGGGPAAPRATQSAAQVTLGDVPLPVTYSGLTPGLVGVYQINAQVPISAPPGMEVPLKITHGGRSTSVALRVVE